MIVFIFLLFLVLLPAGYVSADDYPQINGVQVFVMDEKYKKDVGKFFREAKAKGVNTVFFRVFHNQGDRPHFGISNLACETGVYFKTDALCTVQDVLTPVIKAAKQNGIKIYAWMATRSLTDLKKKEYMAKSLSPNGGVVPGYGANVNNKHVRKTLLKLFEDLGKYDIDGILFQDDFIMKYTEGADKETSDLFFKETGLRTKGSIFFEGVKEQKNGKRFSGYKDEFYIWSNWKAYMLSDLFRELKAAARKHNPNLKFAANVYYETPIMKDNALAWYSQKMQMLLDSGADYLAVMGYHEQIKQELGLTGRQTVEKLQDLTEKSLDYVWDPNRVILKLQSRSFSKDNAKISEKELVSLCAIVRKLGDVSIVLVPIYESEDIYGKCFEQ